jgi:hypothetical protein
MGEGDISSVVQQVSGIFECILGIFFDVCYHASCAITNIGGEHCLGYKNQEERCIAGRGVGHCA